MTGKDPYSEDEDLDTERALSSYSDLFAAISFCFLFLYVVATLQSNISSLQNKQQAKITEQEKIDAVVQKYEKLLAAHQMEKDRYLASAETAEKEAYEEALKDLEHLATVEDEKTARLAQELDLAQKKTNALNNYQRMIKNIVDSNLALKQRVVEKERALEEGKVIFEKKTKERFRGELKNQVKQAKQLAKKEYLEKLSVEKLKFEQELKTFESSQASQLAELEARFETQVKTVRSEKAKTQKEKAALKQQLERLAVEREIAIKELEGMHSSKVSQLQNQFETREQALKETAKKATETAKVAQKALAKARSKSEITKAIANSLEQEFKRNGISATIDRTTGEVTLNFLNVYFDLGQHKLKDEMEADLSKFMPTYAKAIFADKRNVDVVEHIEVIGFASPTYDKKYVDPSTLKVQSLDAVSYNLDLSYKRARSIFKYIFNPKKLAYEHQNEIFKITKVSGRSFLEGKKANGRFPASGSLSREDYCSQFDCKKQQKVVIKFHLKQ